MYKTTSSDVPPEKSRMQSSINQLDNLLDDLQQVKNSSYSQKGKETFFFLQISYNLSWTGVISIFNSSNICEFEYGFHQVTTNTARKMSILFDKNQLHGVAPLSNSSY